MPELPEVEVTRRALAPAVERRTVLATEVREHRLRWPVADLSVLLGRRVERLARRGKYLLWEFAHGTLISACRALGASGPMAAHRRRVRTTTLTLRSKSI